jgi:phage shock protein E
MNTILNIGLVLLLGLLAFKFFTRKANAMEQNEVKQLLNSGAKVIDVRTEGEFESGHYKTALNIPVDKLSSNLNLLGSKEQTILLYCRSGARANTAKSILESNGFKKVINLGGLSDLPKE